MGQDPDVSKGVHVVRGVDRQGCTIAFGIMVHNECVGGTTVAGRITIGLWGMEGGDTLILEGGLEGEGILEGLCLTNPGVFAGSDSRSATVIDLWCARVGQCATI